MENLEEILNNFKEKNILVLGDVMIDKFTWGEIERVNPEQPAAPLVKIINETYNLGGAANVANNIISLSAKCTLYSIIGNDFYGEKIKYICKSRGIEFKHLYDGMETLVKQRFMAHGQQIARADYGEKDLRKITSQTQYLILKDLETEIKKKKYGAVILSDYNKQIFTEGFSKEIISLLNKYNLTTLVDPKPVNIDYFKNCTVISPNKKETLEIINPKNPNHSLEYLGKKLCEKLNSKYSIITCSEEGVFVYSKEGIYEMIETKAREVSNPTGAGDTFIAILALGLSSGADVFSSAELANYAAGIVVEKPGTATTTIEEIEKRIKESD